MSGVRLAEVFLAACQEHGARDAVACDAVACAGEQLSYEQLATRVRRRAVALDAILGTGTERVGLYAHNSIDYVVSYFALLHTGRVPLLIDAQFGAHELGEVNAGCGVTAFLVDRARSGLFPLAGTTVPVAGSDHDLCRVAGGEVPAPRLHPSTAVCRFTSGTTGLPKCLEFSGAAVHAAATNWVDGTGLDGDDRTLCLAAFTNGLAFNTSLLASFLVGADLHIYRGLPTSSKIIASLAASQATRLVAFPVVYRLLVESDSGAEHCAGLQMAISAGTVLSAEVRAEFEGRSGVRIADY
jgi:long-chain acyl-CoA synthetase